MRKSLEFYYDFGSPTAYLAHKRLSQLADKYPLDLIYRPMLLGGVFKATGNSSPVAVPAKGKYMFEYDLPRFADRYGVALNPNPYFPINTLNLMRGAIAAQRLGCSAEYVNAAYDAVWVRCLNMGEPEVVAQVLTEAGLDQSAIMSLTQDPEIKGELIAATEAAVARDIFGTPTFFMDEQMYFGQDRLDFIEAALQA